MRVRVGVLTWTVAAGAAAALAAGPAGAADHVVTTAADAGAGSLREALASGATTITFADGVGDIVLESPLVHEGVALEIRGGGQRIVGDTAAGALLRTTATSVHLQDLAVVDEADHALGAEVSGNGVHVDVPVATEDVVSVTLDGVSIEGVGGHGLWVDDNDASPATVVVALRDVTIEGAGFGDFDQDGVRVDERGDGDLWFHAEGSTFTGAGADGVELDEAGPGSVVYGSVTSTFVGNGAYCDPVGLEVEETDMSEGDFRARFDEAENECVVYEAGDAGEPAAVELDLDDGFDIDEADDGSIVGAVHGGSVSANRDEGLDWDESGPGSIVHVTADVVAEGNEDEAVKSTEEDEGGISTTVSGLRSDGDVESEELAGGPLFVWVADSVLDDLKLAQEPGGVGVLDVVGSTLDEVEVDGAVWRADLAR